MEPLPVDVVAVPSDSWVAVLAAVATALAVVVALAVRWLDGRTQKSANKQMARVAATAILPSVDAGRRPLRLAYELLSRHARVLRDEGCFQLSENEKFLLKNRPTFSPDFFAKVVESVGRVWGEIDHSKINSLAVANSNLAGKISAAIAMTQVLRHKVGEAKDFFLDSTADDFGRARVVATWWDYLRQICELHSEIYKELSDLALVKGVLPRWQAADEGDDDTRFLEFVNWA